MTDSIRNICRLALVAVGLVAGSQVHAASVTVNAGAACTAFTWDQATSTLTCQVSTGCIISGAASGVPGSNVTLTASCPTSTTFTWTGGNCAGVTTGTCSATEATAVGNVNYTVTGNNSAADTHSVNWTNNTVVPSGCSLSANPGSGPSGSNVTLTASCTAGTNPIAIAWGGATGTSGCATTMNVGTPVTCTVNGVTANSTWTASFSNSAGNNANNPRSTSFAVQAGGGGGAFAGCPAGTITIDGQWGKDAIVTAEFGTFSTNIMSIRVTPPANWAPGTSTKTSSWVEFQDAGTVREAVFSKMPCDFTTTNALRSSSGGAFRILDAISPSFKYKLNSPSTTAAGLTPGTSYYINIRNYWSSGALSCTSGSCNMRGGLPQ